MDARRMYTPGPPVPLMTVLPAASARRACRKTPKEIACKYFYDAAGSALFDAICALPEYYQTRTEVTLLRRHAGEMASLIGADAEIVEFGAGALRKIRILLDALERPRGYTPIDISGAYLRDGGALSWRRIIPN